MFLHRNGKVDKPAASTNDENGGGDFARKPFTDEQPAAEGEERATKLQIRLRKKLCDRLIKDRHKRTSSTEDGRDRQSSVVSERHDSLEDGDAFPEDFLSSSFASLGIHSPPSAATVEALKTRNIK